MANNTVIKGRFSDGTQHTFYNNVPEWAKRQGFTVDYVKEINNNAPTSLYNPISYRGVAYSGH